MKALKHFAALLLLASFAVGAAGAAQVSPPPTLRFDHLGVENGLPQESVLAVSQDAQGFMWFGTQAGLARYDGYRMTVFRNVVNDPDSLANNWVRALHTDRRGRLWLGTDGGLDLYLPHTRTFRHYLPREPERGGNGSRRIRAIAEDRHGDLWLATGDGLQHFSTRTGKYRYWHHSSAPGSLLDDQINALTFDATGRLWIGSSSGLCSMAPGSNVFEHHHFDTGGDPKRASVQALLVDREQTLWVGTLAGVELRSTVQHGVPGRRLGPQEGIPEIRTTAMYEDADGTVWVGSTSRGLYRWSPQERRFRQYDRQLNDAHSLADNQVSALFRDRVGTFWVGTWYAGVSRADLAGGGFMRLVRKDEGGNPQADNKVRGIADAGGGRIWVATNGGLDLLDARSGDVIRRYGGASPAPSNQLLSSVVRDRRGRLWVGSHGGIATVDPESGKFVRRSFGAGDASDDIRYMYVDRAGTLWAASRGGLHRVNPDTGESYTYRHDAMVASSLADNVVRPLLEDREGRMWVGTFNGLELMDRATGTFRHFRHEAGNPHSLSHDEVHYLFEDSRGDLWVGTAGGLNRMRAGPDGSVRFERHTAADGMADDAVASILEDRRGDLWVSTNSGISRLSRQTGKWRNYGSGDGTIEGAYFDGSALQTPDGTMYFGGFGGITAFQPGAIRDNRIAPRAVITDIQLFNTSVSVARPNLLRGAIEDAQKITLEAADSVFSLEYSALHYAAPGRNRFAYQLEGFDKAWVQTDASKRFATYTNLDPGDYRFYVRAANKDNVWGDPAVLQITILPPFWKTWWFRTLFGVAVAGAVYGWYAYRTGSLKRQKRRLESLVRSRTEEIALQNRQLELQAEELRQRREEAEMQRAEAEQRRIDTERQKEAVELAHRNISTLSEIGREMSASLDMDTIMSIVYRHVHDLMDARIFCIGFLDHVAGTIEFPFAIDHGVRLLGYTRRLDNPDQFAVWSVTHRREVLVNDSETEYRHYLSRPDNFGLLPTTRLDGARPSLALSMIYVPLVVNDQVMGVICVKSAQRNAYRRVHLDMLQALAAHAAVALDNARAYRELEETQALLLEQERQVRLQTEELALANQALHENEEWLRLAKQRAEDATRQKSEFLANMSHEMRTPLAGVIGMLGFALRDRQLQHATRDQIMRGQANAQALLAIINDLLDFSKIEAGKLTFEKIDFDLAATIASVAALFEEQAGAQSIGFRMELDPALPCFVVGDPTRLRQVLVNLLGNAFKFTHSGSVELKVERLGGEGKFSTVRFSVADTGIGISPEALPRVFQKFEQADSTTTRRYGGTGLGLAICRQLVELMDGAISVQSIVGKGSTFTFTVPMEEGVQPAAPEHAPRAPHTHKLRVLCAEDYPTNQIIVRVLLTELGHDVRVVENGALAVQACAEERFDLVLMDGRMPEMDGATAARLIRAGGFRDAPVLDRDLMIVALTANASDEDRSRYMDAGMDDFLIKPVDEDALHARVARAIERQLERGIVLPPMEEPAQPPSKSELDAMFGVGGDAALARPFIGFGRRSSDLKARLRAAFASDAPARRTDLERALQGRDHEAAGRVLHGMKGSAAYLDATELHLLCGEMERAADKQEWAVIEAALPRLFRLLAEYDPSAPALEESEAKE